MKVALYARVSTADKGQNPENQLIRLREVAKARGDVVVSEYTDCKSGAILVRPELNRMLQDAKMHRFDKVMVTKLDRMMRSLRNMLNVLEDLQKWKVEFECIDQPIDTASAQGRLFLQITAAFAEWEREIITERVNEGVAAAKARGVHCGRPLGSRTKKKGAGDGA